VKLPVLTPELSKRARRELGLSQTDVIKATGLQSYKLKQWEGRGLSIDLGDIRKLTDFYESQGVDIVELANHVGGAAPAATKPDGSQAPALPELQNGFTYTPRPGFMISDQLTSEQVDALMEQMEANDDRIAVLTSEAFKTGMFGGISAESEEHARELICALAENHVIFRALQGRNVVSTARDEPKTIGEFLGSTMKESPVLPLLSGDAKGAINKPKPKAPAAPLQPAPVTADSEE
jgi:hypothetical protein